MFTGKTVSDVVFQFQLLVQQTILLNLILQSLKMFFIIVNRLHLKLLAPQSICIISIVISISLQNDIDDVKCWLFVSIVSFFNNWASGI